MKRSLASNTQTFAVADKAESRTTLRARSIRLENPFRRCRKERRGAAVVEFAIVAPLLFLFVFGMIEYGRMVMVQQVITNASREGARIAVLDNYTYSDVDNHVRQYMLDASIPAAAINPVVMNPANPSAATYGAPVSVTVSVDLDKVTWLPTPIWLGGKSLHATTTMRRESAS